MTASRSSSSMLERRAAAVFGEADAHRGTDVAFALALAR
jgi:hypothetical protein